MKFSRCFFLLFLLQTPFLPAQISFETPVMPSPTAASLGEYGEIPVSHHTGVPNIDIPIYTLSEGGLRLPISLSYHSAGIRVDELASWVGLGWSLNAGGAITRTVVGTPDEGGTQALGSPYGSYTKEGWYQNYGIHPSLIDPQCWEEPYHQYGGGLAYQCREHYLDAADGFIDSEPDLFTFNVAGYSGKFLFDHSGKVHILPFQDILIEPSYDAVNEQFSSWKMTAPDGTKYFFGTDPDAIEHGYQGQGNYVPGLNNRRTTTWFLTRIESLNAENWIEFTYTREKYSFSNRLGHTVMVDCSNPPGLGNYQNLSPILSLTNIDGCRLSQITTSSGNTHIDFVPSSQKRQDITKYQNVNQSNTEAKSLSDIVITSGSKSRRFHLDTDYFLSPNTSLSGLTYTPHDRKRLRLNAIQEITGTTSASPNYSYSLMYDPTSMGRRLSLGRDFWGYYNGADSNDGLIPTGVINPCASQQTPISGLANRNPNANKMKAWMLTQIQYPTGGTTTFEYEPHHDGMNMVGGLRVKTIRTSPDGPTASNAMVKNYQYDNGVLYGTYPIASSFQKVPHTGLPMYSGNFLGQLPGTDVDYVIESRPPAPSQNTQGYHIGYGTVTLDLGTQGRTVYRYHNALPTMQNYYGSFPSIPVQSSPIGGKLYSEEHFDAANQLVQSTSYQYAQDLKDTLHLRVITALAQTQNSSSPTSMPTSLSMIPVFNEYHILLSRVNMVQKTTFLDGVSSTETYQYSAEHHAPISVSKSGSDGSLHVTESKYYDAWLGTFCQGDPTPCWNSYQVALDSTRSLYEQQVIHHIDPSNADTIFWTTIPNSTASAYNAAILQLQTTYQSCLQTVWSSVESCREAELNAFVAPDSSFEALPEMVHRHLITPLEVFQKVDGVVVSGSKLMYQAQWFPTATQAHHLVPTHYQKWVDGAWEADVSVQYDQWDNMIEHVQALGQPSSYLFGKQHQQVIAEVLNASQDEIAYTSFEEMGDGSEEENGGWSLLDDVGGSLPSSTSLSPYWLGNAKTGRLCHRLFESGGNNPTGNRIETIVSKAGTYQLSFWYQGAIRLYIIGGSSVDAPATTEWTWFETEISVPANTILRLDVLPGQSEASIDELRLHPHDAQMRTFCTDQALLPHTITDQNGQSIYYQYDDLGRLIYLKDQDGNYVQGYQYHFRTAN